jgi:TRAP transporter TAXI family solute receptor
VTFVLKDDLTRRRALALLAGGGAAGFVSTTRSPSAQDAIFFRIGTGGTAGTYYPVGALLASIISKAPGSRPCGSGGSCGVPGLVAVAQTTDGSIANVEAIHAGILESGFCQSDILFWAYNGVGIFAERAPLTDLRLIANLYPEVVQIVVRRDAGMESIADLAGKRVSIDLPGSGTLADARIILSAYGLNEEDFEVVHLQSGQSMSLLRNGELDAFFIVAGAPTASVSGLVEEGIATLLPIADQQAIEIVINYPFFSLSAVAYPHTDIIPTLSVGAQWAVSSAIDDDLVYGITSALWDEYGRKELDAGHPVAKEILLKNALEGAAIPLHPGALRYYEEIGLDTSSVPIV